VGPKAGKLVPGEVAFKDFVAGGDSLLSDIPPGRGAGEGGEHLEIFPVVCGGGVLRKFSQTNDAKGIEPSQPLGSESESNAMERASLSCPESVSMGFDSDIRPDLSDSVRHRVVEMFLLQKKRRGKSQSSWVMLSIKSH